VASVVEYLGDELLQDGREFVPTAELAAALEVKPKALGTVALFVCVGLES
jgi:hypothetical protein